ncbi:hypothetical protein E2C01_092134 [Portunus trituberculatus]|uniref:Uncharacterized protein n=1 Tax=Portunus trituberculatus TaxID=210409 RepID=A0A5B7JQK1_PORTR|nr:hypothetical protein [Portunus trituberculatus]
MQGAVQSWQGPGEAIGISYLGTVDGDTGDEEEMLCEREDLKDSLGKGTGAGLERRRVRETGDS